MELPVTPAEITMDEGAEKADPVAALLEKAGLRDVDELVDLAEKARKRDGYDRRQASKVRELEDKIAELQEKREADDWGFTETPDPMMKRLVSEIKVLRSEMETMADRYVKSPQDEELDPYMQKALERFSDALSGEKYPNRIERLEAIRTMAKGLRSEELESKSDTGRARSEDTRREINAGRAYLTGGGPPVSSRSRSDEQEYQDFRKKMRGAKTQSERETLADAWATKHPEEGGKRL